MLLDYNGTSVDYAQMIIDGTIEAFMIVDTVYDIKIGKKLIQIQLEFLGAIIIKNNYIEKMPTAL